MRPFKTFHLARMIGTLGIFGKRGARKFRWIFISCISMSLLIMYHLPDFIGTISPPSDNEGPDFRLSRYHRALSPHNATNHLGSETPQSEYVKNNNSFFNLKNYKASDFPGAERAMTNFFSNVMDKRKSYLKPITTLFTGIDLKEVPVKTKHVLENIIRTGYGLQPYKTDRGEDAWMESGIVYRPSRTKNPNGYTPEFESYVPFDPDMFFEGRAPDVKYKTEKKIILWDLAPLYVFPTPGLEPLRSCPEFPCVYSTNGSAYRERSSAMLFAANEIRNKDVPPKRTSPDQVFVLNNHEPPNIYQRSGFKNPVWKSAFNYTLTYRMDSDFVIPYAIVRRRPQISKMLENKDYRGILANKTRLVAWVSSHCKTKSKREAYVRKLQKFIPVDVMGTCGEVDDCPRTNRDFCTDQLAAKYKFYLSFENAIAQDYFTEKFFNYMLRDVVIVALGSDDYYQHIPSETFINTNDFPSPKALAEKLWALDRDEEAYLNILREKDKYIMLFEDHGILQPSGLMFHNDFFFHAVPMCLLCQRLWNLDHHRQTIEDIQEWFLKSHCKKPLVD